MKACSFLLLAFFQISTFHVDANMVLAPVGVSDSGGNPIRNLKLEDFEIQENGKPVKGVYLGGPGEAPLDFAMLFDISGTVYPRFELERQAAESFLRRMMRPSDSVIIISVANEPKVVQPKTNSLETALQAIEKIESTTQATAFYNSVVKATRMLRETERPEARRVIVALSDGDDNRSIENRPDDVIRELHISNCLFYSINPAGKSYKANFMGRRGQEGMESFSREMGGASFVADDIKELAEFYDRIADELQGQYLLGYYSTSTTGPSIYRTITIKVHGRPEYQIRARQGYYPK
jgi:VWFA-related protein